MTLKVSCRESCKEVYSDLNSMFRSLNSCLQSLDAHSLGSVLKCDAMKASFQLLQIILHLCKVHPRQDIEQNLVHLRGKDQSTLHCLSREN